MSDLSEDSWFSTPEISASLRRERLKAAAKLREEIRNAVAVELLSDDEILSRRSLAKQAHEIVERVATDAVTQGRIERAMDAVINDRIQKAMRGLSPDNFFRAEVKRLMELKAREYVDRRLKITVTTDEGEEHF